MDKGRFEQSSRAGRATRLLAGSMALAAATSAWGGTDSTSFGVGLRITASCQVDSGAVPGAAQAGQLLQPDVRCGFATPRSVRVTREAYEAPLPNAPSAGAAQDDSAVVVTLTF